MLVLVPSLNYNYSHDQCVEKLFNTSRGPCGLKIRVDRHVLGCAAITNYIKFTTLIVFTRRWIILSNVLARQSCVGNNFNEAAQFVNLHSIARLKKEQMKLSTMPQHLTQRHFAE